MKLFVMLLPNFNFATFFKDSVAVFVDMIMS
jgi:hypothetical protein